MTRTLDRADPAWREGMTGGLDPLAALAPIGLDELVAAAALQTRVDRKYLVDAGQALRLVRRLAHRARVLEIGGRREFGYESVYHDTDDLLCYHQAARKRRNRFKVRHRRYLDTGAAFVEVKNRGPRSATVKTREPSRAAGRLDQSDRAFVAEVLCRARIDVDVASLRPVLTTHYDRATLYLPADGARVTIDTGLAWHGLGDRAAATPLVIVETKSGAAPSAADRALWDAGIRPGRISKFGTGLALLDPALPANKWHRSLRRLAMA